MEHGSRLPRAGPRPSLDEIIKLLGYFRVWTGVRGFVRDKWGERASFVFDMRALTAFYVCPLTKFSYKY